MSLQSPLAKVLGRGSAKHGVSHWWVQRLTAVALVPLTLWFVFSAVSLPSYEHAALVAWIADGWRPVLLTLLVATLAWHSALGVQVVIEDYLPTKVVKLTALVVSNFLHVLAASGSIYAVLRIAFTHTAG
jgi:succinate dehydrogenase / fumarate reductase membrane anchor subunit